MLAIIVICRGERLNNGIAQWSTSPEAVPDLTWSDMVLYMISTPSPYTKEEIKASDSTTVIILIYHSNLGLEGDVRWK